VLARSIAVGFACNAEGRMLHANAPERGLAPRMMVAGCAAGNRVAFRHDVADDVARRIEELVVDEPPLAHPDVPPRHLDDYIALLAPVAIVDHGLEWRLPHDIASSRGVVVDLDVASMGGRMVASGTPEGDDLVGELAREMPPSLVEHGFVDTNELWPPWCVAVVDDQIASLVFAARIDAHAAAVGVFTQPAFRGRGLAARATAAWAAHPALRDHVLFYGTSTTNLSSQRVVAQLRLPFFGRALLLT
jgi:hypothetical protein